VSFQQDSTVTSIKQRVFTSFETLPQTSSSTTTKTISDKPTLQLVIRAHKKSKESAYALLNKFIHNALLEISLSLKQMLLQPERMK